MATGGALALAWALMRPPAEPLPKVDAPAPATASANPPLAEPGAPASMPAPVLAEATSRPETVSLSRQVQQLVAAGTPTASFAAYQLLARC